MLLKKTEYNKLITKVDNIDTTGFVSKTKYDEDGSNFEDKINNRDKKIQDLSCLIKKNRFQF